MTGNFRKNNFNLIRLLAALQVAFNHSLEYLVVHPGPVLAEIQEFSRLFPGVPVFFFISGFLLSRSFEINPKLSEYALNRVLRIYPGLALCTLLSILTVSALYSGAGIGENWRQFAAWLVFHLTLFQFWEPGFVVEQFGGRFNPSLWSISVELQFYILLPMLYMGVARKPLWMLALLSLFACINYDYHHLGLVEGWIEQFTSYKVYGVSFVPWVWMFLVGVLFQRYFTQLHRVLAGRFLVFLLAYLVVAMFAHRLLGLSIGNNLNFFLYILLALVVFSGAYSNTGLAERLLGSTDISYGLYIYHVPLVHLMQHFGLSGSIACVPVLLMVSAGFGLLSWRMIERPCMYFKRHPMHAVGRQRLIGEPEI
jgi:peptidoglycan/LPS O-acetylase OafA/YrhL